MPWAFLALLQLSCRLGWPVHSSASGSILQSPLPFSGGTLSTKPPCPRPIAFLHAHPTVAGAHLRVIPSRLALGRGWHPLVSRSDGHLLFGHEQSNPILQSPLRQPGPVRTFHPAPAICTREPHLPSVSARAHGGSGLLLQNCMPPSGGVPTDWGGGEQVPCLGRKGPKDTGRLKGGGGGAARAELHPE